MELLWVADVEPVQYEMDWEVDGTTGTCIRESTKPQYQGSAGASEGNQAVSDWLAEEFQRTGLQQLPGLGSWKQNYSADYEKTKAVDNIIGYLPGKDHTKAVVLGAGFGNPNLATLLKQLNGWQSLANCLVMLYSLLFIQRIIAKKVLLHWLRI